MNIIIDTYLRDDIRERLGTDSNVERCGILIGTRRHDHVLITGWAECPNSSDTPATDYDITEEDAFKAVTRKGFGMDDIIGAVHTHRTGEKADPSYLDVVNMPKDMVGIVLHVTTKRLTYFDNEHGFLRKDDI